MDRSWTDGDKRQTKQMNTKVVKKRTMVILNNGEIKISDNK